MKITGGRPQAPSGSQTADIAKTNTSSKLGNAESLLEAKKSPGVAGSTRVDVSPRAQEMAKAKELATPSNDIDEAKVARLQKLIDDGKYQINADAIADRLLDEQSKMP